MGGSLKHAAAEERGAQVGHVTTAGRKHCVLPEKDTQASDGLCL